jgi:hypothetical protein
MCWDGRSLSIGRGYEDEKISGVNNYKEISVSKLYLSGIAAVVLCFTILLVAVFLPGCDSADKSTTGEIPRQLEKFSMADIWIEVARATDLQPESAALGSLHLTIIEDGVINSLYFDFRGWNKNSRPCLYFASLNYKNKLDILKYEADSVLPSQNPLAVFGEIDKLGLASVERGDKGLIMHIDFQWGDIGFNHNYLDAYQLQDGNLLPLEELIFHTADPICMIHVYKNYVNEDATPIAVSASLVLPGERTSQLWFLSDDIINAESVKYLDTQAK